MEFRRVKANVHGPFLVVAPLTTLGHWRREIETCAPTPCYRWLYSDTRASALLLTRYCGLTRTSYGLEDALADRGHWRAGGRT